MFTKINQSSGKKGYFQSKQNLNFNSEEETLCNITKPKKKTR